MVNVSGLVPVGPDTSTALPIATVKLVSAPARSVGDPAFEMVTTALFEPHCPPLQPTVTVVTLVPVLTRFPPPEAIVTVPPLAATLNVVLPVGAETTLPKLGLLAVIELTLNVCAQHGDAAINAKPAIIDCLVTFMTNRLSVVSPNS